MAHDKIAAILNGLTAAVFVIAENRQTLFANTAARQLFGENLVGQDFVRAVRHPDCLNCIEEVMQGAAVSRVEISLPLPTFTTYQVTVSSLGEGRPDDAVFATARAVISFEDISHILEAEQMRSDFVANVSHELRSPLTALKGFIETLQGAAKEDQEARDRFLEVMALEAQRMSRLISDLLSLSKVEIDERVRPSGLSNVPAIAERVIALLTPQAEAKAMTIGFEKPAPVDAVAGDDDQLTQVFQNLIENAVRYGDPETKIVVTITNVPLVPGIRGPAVSVEIRDSGPGILPEHIPRLTERFYRVDTSRSRAKGGTGLGLAIVKHIVNRHRGRLQIKSEIGVGSTFTVFLPVRDAHI